MFRDIEFAHPHFFWLLAFIPVMLAWYILRNRKMHGTVTISSLAGFRRVGKSARDVFRHSLLLLRLAAIALLTLAMARPQSSLSWQNVTTEGIDIVMALDISGSMRARDLKPNRLEASKDVAIDFISGRPNDRIGLVVYSGESFTQCPITTDHQVLINLFESIRNGMVNDGTAIGMGLATAVNRLKSSEAKSKVVILLTDGMNTTGSVPPKTAADIAAAMGIRVYTIGVGTTGKAPFPFQNIYGQEVIQQIDVNIDEDLLKEIAEMTGGEYFRATDNRKLKAIYEKIDELEKSKINVTEYRKKNERFFPYALIAAILLLLEFVLRNSVFRSIAA